MLGDWHPLVQQLGTTDGLICLSTASHSLQLKNVDSVRLVEEYEPFHGRAGVNGSVNRLYADLHVDGSVPSEIVIGG